MTRSNQRSIVRRHALANKRQGDVPRSRRARFEALESRELLAVSVAEYAAISAQYQEFELPSSMDALNVVELDAGGLSLDALRNALDLAASTRKDDLIVVRTTDDACSIALTRPTDELKVEIDAEMFGKTTIVALGAKPLTLDGAGTSRVLSLAVGDLRLGGLNLQNGAANNFGGCVYNKDALTLKNCVVSGGSVDERQGGLGGDVYSSGKLVAFASSFSDAKQGAGIYSTGTVSLTDCALERNADQGLVVVSNDASDLTDCDVRDNGSNGLENVFGTLTVSSTVVDANKGAGLLNSGSALAFDSTFSHNLNSGVVNQSFVSGAGSCFSADFTADRCVVRGNKATRGAGVYDVSGALSLSNCEISCNVATEIGGGVYCEYQKGYVNKATALNCTIAANAANASGGGLVVDQGFSCAVYNSIVATNYARDLNSNVQGELTTKGDLIDSNVSFVAPPVFNYQNGAILNEAEVDLQLTATSPALNVGDSAKIASGAVDLLGKQRVYGRSVDAGAYEFLGAGSAPTGLVVTVTTLADTFDPNDGKTSLREALFYVVGSKATVQFDKALKGTIKLTSQLVVSSSVTIDGDERITIDAQKKSRAFLAEADLRLVGLTVKNGSTKTEGGVVYAKGALTIEDSTISNGSCGADREAGLVYALGSFVAQNSNFTNASKGNALYFDSDAKLTACNVKQAALNGVYATSRLTMTSCVVEGSGADGIVVSFGEATLSAVTSQNNKGAGLRNVGTTTVANCLFAKNSDSGLVNESFSFNETAFFFSTVVATNTVFEQNTAEYGAGALNRNGRVELTNCVVAANVASVDGGGLYNEPTFGRDCSVTLLNSTVAGNYAANKGGGVVSESANALLLAYNSIVAQNLSGDVDANVSGSLDVGDGSYVGGAPGFIVAPIFDFVKGRLTNPEELNLRLGANAAAIDSGVGSYSVVTKDLDGNARNYGAEIDPGAYEYCGTSQKSVEPSWVVTTLDDSFDLNDGVTSLREALYWANDPNATITFDSNLYGSIVLTSQLTTAADVEVNGDGRVTIDAAQNARALVNEGELTLRGIDVRGNVHSSGALTLNDVDVRGSVAAYADANAKDSTFSHALDAPGIAAFADLVLTDCVVANNETYGVYSTSTASLTRCRVERNGLDGIYNEYGSITLDGARLASNQGAGLRNLGSALVLDSTICDNADSGLVNLSVVYGERSSFSSTLKLYNSVVKGNKTVASGGGVLNDGAYLEIANCEISANEANEYGGGVCNIWREYCANLASLTNCTIAGNYAGVQGGGVFVDVDSFVFKLYNSIVAKNFSTLANANVEGVVTESERNLTSGNPSFVVAPIFSDDGELQNKQALDLRLTTESVAVNYGANDRVFGDVDLDDVPRTLGDAVDLGAYETSVGVDLVVQEGCAFELVVPTAASDRVYWDLSGDGSGEFVQTPNAFWVDVDQYRFEPGAYELRERVLDRSGAVKSEETKTLQTLQTLPLVSVDKIERDVPNVVMYAIDARFLGKTPDRTWRIDWGDGSSNYFTTDNFTAAKLYVDPDPDARYSINLTLLDGKGRDKATFEVGLFDASVQNVKTQAAPILTTSVVQTTPLLAPQKDASIESVDVESQERTDATPELRAAALVDLYAPIRSNKRFGVHSADADDVRVDALDDLWQNWADDAFVEF